MEILMRLEKEKQLIEPFYFPRRVTLKCEMLEARPLSYSSFTSLHYNCLRTEVASLKDNPSSTGVRWIPANQTASVNKVS